MTRRIVPLLLLAVPILAVGLASADDPADKGEAPPLRLKKKNRPAEPAPAGPAKDKEKDKAKAKEKEEPLEPEDGPGQPEEDEKEVLARLGKNMRAVEEKLANKELGDPTRQAQEDILKDLDALIRKSQQQSGGGGGADNPPPAGGQGEGQQPKAGGGRGGSRQQAGRGSGRGQRRTARSGSGSGRAVARGGQKPSGGTGSKPKDKPSGSAGGTNPGGGGSGPDGMKDRTADLYKDVWGHLPESLRAEMNAYSNPQPFLPRYDDLIKKYYRTIAEQGRRKGD